MKKIAELDSEELVARIVADEDRLRKWHRPRLEHLEQTRLIRILDEKASLPQNDPLLAKLVTFIISVRPREYWDWAVSTLALQPFRYQNPYSTEARRWGQGEKSGAMVEYLAYGIAAQEDDLSGRTGEEAGGTRFELARQIASGSYAFFPKPEEIEGGDVVFRRDFYDPSQVFWLPGRYGMRVVLRSWIATLLEVRLLLEENEREGDWLTGKETDPVQCIEAYYLEGSRAYNAFVTVGGMDGPEGRKAKELALPLKLLKGYEYIPLICGSVNIMDTAPSREGTQYQAPQPLAESVSERWGRSVLDPVIRVVRDANAWESLARLSAAQALNPTEVRKTRGGAAPDEPPVGPGEQRRIIAEADSDEGLSYVARPSPALDVSRQSDRFAKELDIATISPSLMGQVEPQVASGFLREGWEATTRAIKTGIYDEAMKAVEKRSKMQSIRKFKQMGGKTHLWGRHPQERKGLDGHFEGDYTPDQVPSGFWAIEVYRAPARPIDMAAIGNEARARQLSKEISRRREREMIGIEDPEGEQEQIDRENLEALPLMVAMKDVEGMRQMLKQMRDRIAELRAEPGKAQPGEDVERMERQADMQEAVYLKADQELAMMGGTMAPNVQGQLGREVPQPNASTEAPMPGPGVQPPEMRGEGKMQRQAARMAGVGGP